MLYVLDFFLPGPRVAKVDTRLIFLPLASTSLVSAFRLCPAFTSSRRPFLAKQSPVPVLGSACCVCTSWMTCLHIPTSAVEALKRSCETMRWCSSVQIVGSQILENDPHLATRRFVVRAAMRTSFSASLMSDTDMDLRHGSQAADRVLYNSDCNSLM